MNIHTLPTAGPRQVSHPALRTLPRPPTCPKARAALLDTLAGIELQHGHADAAERLAWRADALRSAAQ